MEKIVIEEKHSRAMLMVTLGFLMLMVSAAFWVFGIKKSIVFIIIIGFILTLMFGIYFLILLSRALESTPLLTITFDGINISSSIGSDGYIAFQDIQQFCIVSLSGKKVIGIMPKDEESFIKKLPPAKQAAARTNLNMKCPPYYIRVDRAKDILLEDIYTLLKKRLDDYSSLYD